MTKFLKTYASVHDFTRTTDFNAQVTHSRIWSRISHGYDPASSVAIRISPFISVLHP